MSTTVVRLASRSHQLFGLPRPCLSKPSLLPNNAFSSPSSLSISCHLSLHRSMSSSSSSLPSTMRAAVLVKAGPEFQMQIEELQMPKPKRGEVLIRTKASTTRTHYQRIPTTTRCSQPTCGVCHSDLHVMKGAFKFPVPAVMGHEMSGEIVHCGDDLPAHTSYDLTPDQRVVVPFILPCGVCRQCMKGREDLCDNFVLYNRVKGVYFDGTTRLFRQDGTPVAMYSMAGLAEYVVAPANSVFPLSNEASWSEASIVGCSVFTAYGAVKHAADVRVGESVAVIGCGGVGASVIQICKVFGAAQIIAIDVAEDKLQQMKQLGATHTINAQTTSDVHSAILALTDQQGVDVAIEALGRPATFQQATQAVAKGGRAVAIGLASPGVFGQIEMNNLVRRGVRVIGSYGGRVRQDMPVVVDLVERGVVDVKKGISKRYQGLEKAQQAYEDLQNGKITGRCIVEMM